VVGALFFVRRGQRGPRTSRQRAKALWTPFSAALALTLRAAFPNCGKDFSRGFKSTGSNLGWTLRGEFFPHSFSQSSNDGTVTSACFE
jgi:hypothetical protein